MDLCHSAAMLSLRGIKSFVFARQPSRRSEFSARSTVQKQSFLFSRDSTWPPSEKGLLGKDLFNCEKPYEEKHQQLSDQREFWVGGGAKLLYWYSRIFLLKKCLNTVRFKCHEESFSACLCYQNEKRIQHTCVCLMPRKSLGHILSFTQQGFLNYIMPQKIERI